MVAMGGSVSVQTRSRCTLYARAGSGNFYLKTSFQPCLNLDKLGGVSFNVNIFQLVQQCWHYFPPDIMRLVQFVRKSSPHARLLPHAHASHRSQLRVRLILSNVLNTCRFLILNNNNMKYSTVLDLSNTQSNHTYPKDLSVSLFVFSSLTLSRSFPGTRSAGSGAGRCRSASCA